MGLLKHLLFWPVTGPKYLIDFSLRRVDGVVRDELTDDTAIKVKLMELQLELELGDIDDSEYARREAELMERLRDVRRWREEFGMGVPGGAVRVAGSQQPAAEGVDADVTSAEGAGGVARPEGASIEIDFDADGPER